MIKNKLDLIKYIEADMLVYGRKHKYPKLFYDETWKFILALRKHEYYHNQKGLYYKIMAKFWGLIHHHYGLLMGWDIPVNTFGPGLKINHYGLIVVNKNARVGAFCDIHQGVNIGQHGNNQFDTPTLGDNIWIGPGAKIFGKINIASGIAIGANAVVNKSFNEKNISIAGTPAKKVSNNGNPYTRNFNINNYE